MKSSGSLLLNAMGHPDSARVPVSGAGIFTIRIQAGLDAKEIVWSILVEKVIGAPATASLFMALQGCFPTTKGNETPPAGVGIGIGGSYNMTEVAQQWFTLDDTGPAGFLIDGDFPVVVADQTISTGTLAAAMAVGDVTLTSATQYPPGSTLNIDFEQFYVVGPPTISGSNWVHPIVSNGSPTSGTSSGYGRTAVAHTNGTTIHAPRALFKRVAGGFGQRLLIVPTFTGGTNPAFLMTINALARG